MNPDPASRGEAESCRTRPACMTMDDPMPRRNLISATLLVAGLCAAGCGVEPGLLLPARERFDDVPPGFSRVVRIAHISDTHIIDTLSPARFPGAHQITRSAWRPYEAYSTQVFDGIVRAINRMHAAGDGIDFVVHTGDACDNVQVNELEWLLGVMDGDRVDPLSGPDDRPAADRPPPLLDPYASFEAQGLYRDGVHGEAASVPWYIVFGNHDVYAIGVFPIVTDLFGRRLAPLPLPERPGLVLPVYLHPTSAVAYAHVTPASPGPPALLTTPQIITPSAERRFFDRRAFIRAMFTTATGPPGHGFADPETGESWYSVAPLPGLRLIGLDTCDHPRLIEGLPFHEGGMSLTQRRFLRAELDAAEADGELVVVVSHHPSNSLMTLYGGAIGAEQFRALLNEYPNVVLHLAGHTHRNRVNDHGGYIEIETCSTLDPPQEARIVEIWQDDLDGTLMIRYFMFSHIEDTLPPLGDDPLRAMRETARSIALKDDAARRRQMMYDPTGADPRGTPFDRRAEIFLPR